MSFWDTRNVVLLGGANIIGVHIGKALIDRNVKSLVIVDNLSAGRYENVKPLIKQGAHFSQFDLRTYGNTLSAVRGMDIVFDLAAQHGGRGYVSSHATNLWNNLELDTTIFRACADIGVEKVIFSSSACAYPNYLQKEIDDHSRLYEDAIRYKDMLQPDGPYGVEKLVGEMMLDDYIEEGAFKGCSTRSFTVYGPLMKETHAICAFIAKTMIKQEPFEVWGDGKQLRNWTFVEDNAQGALLAAEHLDRGAVNIGVDDRLTPMDALNIIWEYVGWYPNEVKFLEDKPTGPVNRVANAAKLKSLGWEPSVSFSEGLRRTIDWYYSTHDETELRKDFERKLTEI